MPTHGGLSNADVDNSGVEPNVARLGNSTYIKLIQTYLYVELKILYFPPVFPRPVQVKHQIVARVRRIINQNLASSNHLGEQLHHGIIISFSSSLFCNSWTVLIFPSLLFCNSEWSTLHSFLVFLLFFLFSSFQTYSALPHALQFLSLYFAIFCFLLLSCSAVYVSLICALLFSSSVLLCNLYSANLPSSFLPHHLLLCNLQRQICTISSFKHEHRGTTCL